MHRYRLLIAAWIATALLSVALPAAFVAYVDPFGFFGTNTAGFYYSSEREFKQNLVRGADYNAIVFGDSRIALIDASRIGRPQYKFLNGGYGGATFAEQVALLSASKLDDIDLVVFGIGHQTLSTGANCQEQPTPYRIVNAIRYSAAWTQVWYAAKTLYADYVDAEPYYAADGTRLSADKDVRDTYTEKAESDYARTLQENVEQYRLLRTRSPGFHWAPNCLTLFERVKRLAEQHEFRIVIVVLPLNRDLLNEFDTSWLTSETSQQALDDLRKIAPVVNFIDSEFSDRGNFWRHDPTHIKPGIGGEMITQAIERATTP